MMRCRRAGIEVALFQVEVPGAVLLRHQAALQPVGETADGALQMRQLLVEEGAQALQLGSVAELLGGDDLVELLGKDVIIDLLVEIGKRRVRAAGLAGRFRIVLALFHHVVVGDFGAFGLAVLRLLVGDFAILDRGRVGAGIVVDLVLIRLVAVRLVFLIRLVVGIRLAVVVAVFLGHLHRRQHVADDLGKGLLIVDDVRQIVELRTGLLLDEGAPQIENLPRGNRRSLAGQLLTHHHGDGLADRRIFLSLDAGEIRLRVLLLGHGTQVGGHAFHPQRSDRFDPRLLDGVEDRTRIRTLRRHCGMHFLIVAGEPKRHGIAKAAGHRQLVCGRPLGKFRQANALSRHTGTFVGESHLDLAVACNRANAAGYCTPQRLDIDWAVRLCFGIVTTRCHDRPA